MKDLPQILTVFLSLMCMNAVGQKPTKTSNANDQWEIQWSATDEFNNRTNTMPNWNKWIEKTNHKDTLPNTTGWKWDNTHNTKIKNGAAELTMTHNAGNVPINGTYFESGILKSKKTFTYGYYEARIKGADIGEGVCPSFWLFSNFKKSATNGQPIYCEIDVVELQQFDWWDENPTGKKQDDIKDLDLNLHAVVKENGKNVWRRPKAFPEAQLNKYRANFDPTKNFHIYGCEVNETEIIWYIDGNKVASKPNTIWKRPMNVTLSLGLRKPFVKYYNNANHAINPLTDDAANAKLSKIPTKMYVDYVRVWKKVDRTRDASTESKLNNEDLVESLCDGSLDENVSVYPNPYTDGMLTIAKTTNSDATVTIFNTHGKEVYTNKFGQELDIRINLQQLKLPKGLYIVKVQNAYKTTSNKLLVK